MFKFYAIYSFLSDAVSSLLMSFWRFSSGGRRDSLSCPSAIVDRGKFALCTFHSCAAHARECHRGHAYFVIWRIAYVDTYTRYTRLVISGASVRSFLGPKQFSKRSLMCSWRRNGSEFVRTEDRQGYPLFGEWTLRRWLLVYARMETSYP